jgi:hypothetical protein
MPETLNTFKKNNKKFFRTIYGYVLQNIVWKECSALICAEPQTDQKRGGGSGGGGRRSSSEQYS